LISCTLGSRPPPLNFFLLSQLDSRSLSSSPLSCSLLQPSPHLTSTGIFFFPSATASLFLQTQQLHLSPPLPQVLAQTDTDFLPDVVPSFFSGCPTILVLPSRRSSSSFSHSPLASSHPQPIFPLSPGHPQEPPAAPTDDTAGAEMK